MKLIPPTTELTEKHFKWETGNSLGCLAHLGVPCPTRELLFLGSP